MPDTPSYPDADPLDATGDTEPSGGRPRWIKVSAIVAFVLVALVVVLLLVGGHGPGRH